MKIKPLVEDIEKDTLNEDEETLHGPFNTVEEMMEYIHANYSNNS